MVKVKFPKIDFSKLFNFGKKSKVKSKTGDYMVKASHKPNQKANKLLKSFARYFVLLTLTVMFFVIAGIAMPLTEKVYPDISFDLNDKEYISKSYILELKIKKSDENSIDSKIAQTKRILTKRLYKAGAQQVSITGYHSDTVTSDDDKFFYRQLQVKVIGSANELDFDQMIYVRSYMRFYTFNDGVDTESEGNELAIYLEENYTPTDITRHDFRTIFMKKVTNDDGTEAYQAIFKSWPFDGRFEDFISENGGKKIGIGGLDYSGAITPIDVPIEYSKSIREITGEPFLFSLTLSGDKRQAELTGIQLNSGMIPLEYSVVSQQPVERASSQISHLYLAGAVLLIISGFAIFSRFIMKEKGVDILVKMFTLLMTFATFFAIFKFLIIPIDLSLLYLTSVLFIVIAFVVSKRSYDNNDYFITLAVLALTWLIGFGVVKEMAFTLMLLTTLHIILRDIVRYYLVNMNKFIQND